MRKKVLFVAALVVVLGLAAWYWFIYLGEVPTFTNQVTNQAVNQPIVVNTNTPTPVVPEPQDPNMGWRVLSMNFAERYGTYSTDLPFQNLKTLSLLVTPDFQARLQAQVASGATPQGFYSVTTRALIADTVNTAGNSMVVNVSTQRSERFARDAAPQLSYPVLQLTLSQSNDAWLVSSAVWQK